MKVLVSAPLFPGNIWQYLGDSFVQLGVEVEFFDYRAETFGKDYFLNKSRTLLGRLKDKAFLRLQSSRMNRRFVDRILTQKPDIVLVIKGELIFPETIRYLRQKSLSKLVIWYPDSSTFLGPTSTVPNITNSLKFYELVLFCDPQHVPPELLIQINEYEMLTFGCHPTVHRSVDLTDKEHEIYGSEVSFIGNSHFEGSLRYKTIETLLAHGINLRCWGENWKNTPLPQQYPNNFGGAVYGEEMVKVCNASKIVLNINGDYPYLNVRNFEAPACGTCTIASAVNDLDKYFVPGEEVVAYNSTHNLIKQLEHYLSNDQEREDIARAGQSRAHQDHTLQHRMAELLQMTGI